MTRTRSTQFRTRPSLQALEARELLSFTPIVYTMSHQNAFPWGVIVTDLNGDGKRDVASAVWTPGIAVLLNDGPGNIGPGNYYGSGLDEVCGLGGGHVSADVK